MAFPLRRSAQLLGVLALSILALVVTFFAALQVPAFSTFIGRRLLGLAPLNPGYHIEIGSIAGNWLTHLDLRDVRLRYDGRTLAQLDEVRVEYHLRRLFASQAAIRELSVTGGWVAAQREGQSWDIAQAIRQSGDTTSTGSSFTAGRLDVTHLHISVALSPDSVLRVRDLELRAQDVVLGDRALLRLDTLHATVMPPVRGASPLTLATRGAVVRDAIRLDSLELRSRRTTLAGRVVLPRQLDDARQVGKLYVNIRGTPVALADVAAFVPGVVPNGHVQLEIGASAEGRLARVTVTARLDTASLVLQGNTLLGVDAPVDFRVAGDLSGLDPARILKAAPRGKLTGTVDVDVHGQTLRTADGHAAVRLGQWRRDGSRVGDLSLAATLKKGRAQVRLRGAMGVSAMTGHGWLRPFDSLPSYELAGAIRQPPGSAALARVLADSVTDPALDFRYRVAGTGAELRTARIAGELHVTVIAAGAPPFPAGDVTLRLDRGRLRAGTDLRIAGGRVAGTMHATLADTMRYRLQGTLAGVGVGRLIADSQLTPISGRFTAAGHGASPATAVATARVELDDVRYRAALLENLVLRGRLQNGRAGLTLGGTIGDGVLVGAGSARVFDSIITFALDSASLQRVDLGSVLGRPDFSGPVTTRLTATGRWGKGVRAFRARTTIARSRVGRIEIAGGTAAAALSDGRLVYDASIQTDEGSLQVRGDAAPTPQGRAYRLRGGLDSLDLGVLLGRQDFTTKLYARVSANATGTTLATARGHLDLEVLPSFFDERPVGPGTVRLEMADGNVTGRAELRGTDARLAADLSGRLVGEDRYWATRGTLRVERLDRWLRDSSLSGEVDARFDLRATSDTAGMVGAVGILSASGRAGAIRVESLYVKLDPGGGLVVDTLLLRSNVATIDGGGRLPLRGDSEADTLHVVARVRDVSALAHIARVEVLSLDSSRVELMVAGPPAARRLAVDANARRLLYNNTLMEQLDAKATATLNGSNPGPITGSVQVRGLATGALTFHQVEVTGRYDSVAVIEAKADLGHGVHLDLALDGTSRNDTTAGRVERLDLVEGGRAWSLEQGTSFVLQPGALAIRNLSLRTGDRRVALDGVVSLAANSDFTLQVDRLELGDLARAGLVPIPGLLDGVIRLKGPPSAPVMEGELSLTLHEGRASDLGQIRSSINWTSRRLRMEAFAAHRSGGKLTISGVLPWGLTLAARDTAGQMVVVRQSEDSMDLTVQADTFEIALLRPFVPGQLARNLRGDLAVDAHLSGTPQKPAARGDLRLTGLGLDLPLIDVSYERGIVAAHLDGLMMRIDTLLLYTGKQEQLSGQGRLRLEPLTNPTIDLAATLRDFELTNAGMLLARASGDVKVSGTLETPFISGALRMGHTEFHATGSGALDVEDVTLSAEDRLQVARHFGPRVLSGADAPVELLDRFGLSFDLVLPEQVWFRRKASPKIDVEVTGRIRLEQQPHGDMQFFGSVEPLPGRSTLDVFGRTFELTGGEIILDGPVEQARMAVNAQYQPPIEGGSDDAGVTVFVTAGGRLDSLGLDFTSEPSMPHDDIISYIVTGRPASDNPLIAQSSGSQGEELVLGQLSAGLSDVVSRELGFDVFQIRQEPTQGLVLTAGRYLTPRFFASLQQPLELGGDANRLPGTTLGPGFELQYRLRPWLRINMRGGSLPSGLLLRGRYGY